MFTAHSPDNSFMGFVVERHVETPPTLARNISGDLMKKNQAVVYGKAEYMWSVRIAGVIYVRHTHPFNGLFSGATRGAGTRKVKPIWISLKQETVSGSGIGWAICKSAPRSRQITMPAPHHSVFYRPGALPATQPTASKHWRHSYLH